MFPPGNIAKCYENVSAYIIASERGGLKALDVLRKIVIRSLYHEIKSARISQLGLLQASQRKDLKNTGIIVSNSLATTCAHMRNRLFFA